MTKNIKGINVQQSCCKSCPFKKDSKGNWSNPTLANDVISRTLFKAQQLCHSTKGGGPGERPQIGVTKLCRGARDHNMIIYARVGMIKAPTDEAFEEMSNKLKEEKT